MTIFLIEDDPILSECLQLTIERQFSDIDPQIRIFNNVFDATQALDEIIPDVIILEVLLNGPNSFSLLNELSSYHDTARIPVILLSSVELDCQMLQQYNVRHVLPRDTMRPVDLGLAVKEALAYAT